MVSETGATKNGEENFELMEKLFQPLAQHATSVPYLVQNDKL